ncbi:molecular chaperone HscC [Clostridium sp. P21]|uniref:Chaperone protein DnaK n=1 Tax=Clostridium muellerianum TaxID=2716538 RepID=A0A7Y0EG82_9CLOT|nr:molecular chaperone HscC [Clostridium muellerianum]NMM62936.1 molecular chaperone HscC [Clostridium muellerianum]
MAILGIDLGTTNSLISYFTENAPIIIPNALGSKLTPSVVSIDDNGEILVGQVAKERLITHPHCTVAAFKRYMGTNKTFHIGEHKFLPEELSSFIIRSLKMDAEAYLGEPVEEVIISVPAYFNDTQRKATQRAGRLAGLKVERLINEPTAAAVAYGLHQKETESNFLVFDLGGGTFDVSILELFENVMEVRAVSGNNFLGGEDFTEVLVNLFIEHHKLNKEALDLKVYVALRKQAEICKKNLKENNSAFMNCHIDGQVLEFNITRQEFEASAKPLINKLRSPIERALKDASINPDELDSIILVGGATRMPLISSFISKLFGRIPCCSINPDEAVALGAGIQAAMKERNSVLKEVVLTDVCPYTLGTDVVVRDTSGKFESGHFFPIIERNTVIPASKQELLYTIYDNQKSINVGIYQGESRLTENNIKLGELNIDVPQAPAGMEAIAVRYTYDINGILEVEVTAVETGLKKRIVIEENPGMMSEEEITKRLKALENIKIHPRDRMENKLLIARGERLYEECLGNHRILIDNMLQDFEYILKRQNNDEIRKAANVLKKKLDQIEKYQEF